MDTEKITCSAQELANDPVLNGMVNDTHRARVRNGRKLYSIVCSTDGDTVKLSNIVRRKRDIRVVDRYIAVNTVMELIPIN